MEYVLAVDGGNTKTIALVAALDGTVRGAGRARYGDIYTGGTDENGFPHNAIANIEAAVTTALTAAHARPTDLVCAVFSMAGADWPEDFALLHDAMQARGFGHTILVQNDALGVLHVGLASHFGVSVICGTAAATGARGRDGRTWHSSFWQMEAHGSEDLGQKTLTAVYRSELGLDEQTALRESVLDYFVLPTVEAVLHRCTARSQRGLPRPHLAGLTPILLDVADAGDRVARRIVREHGWLLGNYAVVAARRVGIEGEPFPLVLAGGVLRHPSTTLQDAIVERVSMTSPQVQPTRSRFEPVVGGLLAALEMAGTPADDALVQQLIPTLPDSSLFDTVSPCHTHLRSFITKR
jgi:N-acetylglucosamine kinase-like BadF-type ATPase